MNAHKIRVIIIDDSAVIRNLFSDMLKDVPDIEVVAVAEDPFDAREKIKALNPDVITLDIEMPKMDGISFLEKIMTLRPMPVIMISSLTTRGADITLRAIELGAVDYIAKPEVLDEKGYKHLRDELSRKIIAAARSNSSARSTKSGEIKLHNYSGSHNCLIAIGASTGGVEAIRDVLKALPANTPPVVITQHMPAFFTETFARRMDSMSAMTVKEASQNEKIIPGHVYIAPGAYHMEIKERGSDLFCHLHEGEQVSGHRPSVDVLFESVSHLKHRKLVGVILTGMGRDGASGLLKMRSAGAATIGQSEASCVVYGMPKAAKLMGAVEREVPLSDIAHTILSTCTSEGARHAASHNH